MTDSRRARLCGLRNRLTYCVCECVCDKCCCVNVSSGCATMPQSGRVAVELVVVRIALFLLLVSLEVAAVGRWNHLLCLIALVMAAVLLLLRRIRDILGVM